MSAQNDLKWDYIIVGTGMGAGPLGLKLAQSGSKVLFLEKGRSSRQAVSIKGDFAETFSGDRSQNLKNGGRFSGVLFDQSNGREKILTPFIGRGVGGSSALYGAVLQRLKTSDFVRWPISEKEMENYYAEAEKIFSVGASENFNQTQNKNLFENLQRQGLSPYALPTATKAKARCQGCQSYLCAIDCKNEAGTTCIYQAVDQHGAELYTECHVERIIFSKKSASGVLVTKNGVQMEILGRHVVLAAGALMSPVILQNSGVGLTLKHLGRNLMRHYVDLYALKVSTELAPPSTKEIAFDDFYEIDGETYGTVQSFGRLPPVAIILEQLQKDLGALFRIVKPLLRPILEIVLSKRLVMTSIIEDSPSFENRVWNENGKICINYRISSLDQQKIKHMRKCLRKVFKKYSVLKIFAAEKNEMLAHVCGTCRMGTDAENSVVDRENRVHGFNNLYVVDASFFPTSGGTNPALTIAANSLRVADLLLRPKRKW